MHKRISAVLISGKCIKCDYIVIIYPDMWYNYIISYYYNVQTKNKLIYQIKSSYHHRHVCISTVHTVVAGDMFNMQYYNKFEAHFAQTQHRALRSLLPGLSFLFFFFSLTIYICVYTHTQYIYGGCSRISKMLNFLGFKRALK